MIHDEVYGLYKECLPDRAADTKEYFPNGKTAFECVKIMGRTLFLLSLNLVLGSLKPLTSSLPE